VNVGCRDIELVDSVQRAPIVLRVFYPTRAPEKPERFGAYPLDVARNGPVEGTRLPLVVLSHGTGGSPLVYRGLAAFLAREGFVVALPEHPGNKRNDDGLARTAANLANRPRHIRLTIDAALADPWIGPHLALADTDADADADADAPHATVIGHSMGGYTALAVAGGRPTAYPSESPDGVAHPVAVTRDPRVGALVLLAPATVWFKGDDALADIDVPILMRTAELDEHTPALHAEIVRRGLRGAHATLDHRVVPNAGHFAFLTPFPPALQSPAFPPSQDPPGFDRARAQEILHAEILHFLRGLP
jgi:predicted dienelactone hydrolase